MTSEDRGSFVDDQTNPRRIAILKAIKATREELGTVSHIFERALAEQGFKVVPIEPTKQMISAGYEAATDQVSLEGYESTGYSATVDYECPASVWAAMLSAVK